MKNIFSKDKKILFLQISLIICFFISLSFFIYFGFIRTQNVNTQAEQFSSNSEFSGNSNLSDEPIVAELSNEYDEDNSEISIDELEEDQEIITDDKEKNNSCCTSTPHAGTYKIYSRYRWLKLFLNNI